MPFVLVSVNQVSRKAVDFVRIHTEHFGITGTGSQSTARGAKDGVGAYANPVHRRVSCSTKSTSLQHPLFNENSAGTHQRVKDQLQ